MLGQYFRRLGRKKTPLPRGARGAEYRLTYARFREILTLNDGILRLISEVEDKACGRTPFALPPMREKLRQAGMHAALIVKDLNQITGGRRYAGLYQALGRLQKRIDAVVDRQTALPEGPFTLTLSEIRRESATLAGLKAATLGELRAALGLRVPDGFVITTSAFARMIRAAGQLEAASSLESLFEQAGRHALVQSCKQVREGILSTPPPPEIVEAIAGRCQTDLGAARPLLAVRSSAVGEDSTASHAGQYLTRLHVPFEELASAWREVIASAFSPDAVVYRYLRGLAFEQAAMAVLVLPMLQPRAAGVLFTRDVQDPSADAVVISITGGTADALVSGRADAIEITLRSGADALLSSSQETSLAGMIRPSELTLLWEAGRRLEDCFGCPQDVEWAVEHDGSVFFLQSRPLALAPAQNGEDPVVDLSGSSTAIPVVEGGHSACPGIGIGLVRKLVTSELPDSVPAGSVLLARNAVVELARFMPSCAAVITEVGSPTSHMSILSREFGVPTLVGVAGVFDCLSEGDVVTVDAARRRVFNGSFPIKGGRRDSSGRVTAPAPLAGSPVVRSLSELGHWIVPLHLTDPAAPEFAPEHCQSLHDLTRFVHESVYGAMFGFGEEVQRHLPAPLVLDARLPLVVHLFDVGGGLRATTGGSARIPLSDISSEPMRAFVRGLTDPRIEWNRPRSISAGGFLSVVGRSMIGAPAETHPMAEASFCVLSANYMNFAARTGYHFSAIDTWCGNEMNRNYVHFHFSGGGAGAERRERRQRFLARILTHLQFQVRCRGDFVTARLDKFDRGITISALEQLGRLTLCARQLDMLMDTEASPGYFAEAFLREDLTRF